MISAGAVFSAPGAATAIRLPMVLKSLRVSNSVLDAKVITLWTDFAVNIALHHRVIACRKYYHRSQSWAYSTLFSRKGSEGHALAHPQLLLITSARYLPRMLWQRLVRSKSLPSSDSPFTA